MPKITKWFKVMADKAEADVNTDVMSVFSHSGSANTAIL
jgi:hypothetical protein